MDNTYDHPEVVRVFSQERYEGEWMPSPLSEAIEWMQAMLECVPEEHRASATIELDSISSWEDAHYAKIIIEYRRPPTASEIAERKAAARQRIETDLAWARGRATEEEARLAALSA